MGDQAKRESRHETLCEGKSNRPANRIKARRSQVKQPRKIHPFSIFRRVRENILTTGKNPMLEQVLSILEVNQGPGVGDLRDSEQQCQTNNNPSQHEVTTNRLVLDQFRRQRLPLGQSFLAGGSFRKSFVQRDWRRFRGSRR